MRKGDRIYYKLNESQKMLLLSQTYTLSKQINNVFTLILVQEALDFDTLRRAIEHAYAACDTLRIRFVKSGREIRQIFLEKETPSIRVLDFTGRTREQMDQALYKLAAKPFYIKNRLMSRFYLVRSCDGMSGIYLGVSHMVLDSWGICVLVKYIMDVYEAMKAGAAAPDPLASAEAALAKDLEYRDSAQYRKDRQFWEEECKRPEPYYTHINGSRVLDAFRKKAKKPGVRHCGGMTLFTKGRHEVCLVPKEAVDEMKAYCAQHNMPLQALFLLGVRTCLSMRNDRQEDITFVSTVARRGTKAEKLSGGTRVYALLFRTVLPEDVTFEAAMEEVCARQSLIYRHAEFGLLDYLPLIQAAYCENNPLYAHYSMAVTFQPVQLTLNGGRPCRTRWYCNGAATQSFYVTVMDDDGSGALRVYYEYQSHIIEPQTIYGFHKDLERVMLTGVRNPDITVGELLDGNAEPQKAAQPEQTA